MTCEQIQELLEAYSLDALDPDERSLVEAHLATCPDCQTAAKDYAVLTADLPQALARAAPALPPAALKARLLETVATDIAAKPNVAPTPKPSVPSSRPTASPRIWSWRLRLRPLEVGLALALLLIVLIWNLRLSSSLAQERALRAEFANLVDQQEVVLEVIDSPQTVRRLLRPQDVAGPAPPYGKIFTRPDLPHVVAMIARLPQPPAGQGYHLWLTAADGSRKLAGVLQVNEDGFGLLVFDETTAGPTYEQAELTLQPLGSTEPAGPPILRWEK